MLLVHGCCFKSTSLFSLRYSDKFWQANTKTEDKSIHHLTAVSWCSVCACARARMLILPFIFVPFIHDSSLFSLYPYVILHKLNSFQICWQKTAQPSRCLPCSAFVTVVRHASHYKFRKKLAQVELFTWHSDPTLIKWRLKWSATLFVWGQDVIHINLHLVCVWVCVRVHGKAIKKPDSLALL